MEIEHKEPDPSEPKKRSDDATAIGQEISGQVPGLDAGQIYRQARDHQAAVFASSYDVGAGLDRLVAWMGRDSRSVADAEVALGQPDGRLTAHERRVAGEIAAPEGGPTVLRILLGAQLRRLRESAVISREDAGYHIRASGSKISRMELGRVSFKERDVTDLLEYYGVRDPEEREKLVQLTREANQTPWWQKYQEAVPDWFQVFVGLEEAAQLIREYEVQFVPGLLQTEDYARAVVLQGTPGLDPQEVERRVALRMGRQQVLKKENPPRLWAIVDEAALRRPMGGRDVLVAQIERLMDAVSEPNVTLQVMPFRYGGHAAEGGAFMLMRFPEADLPDMVYMEYLTGALYLDKPDEVERYAAVMERLSVAGTSPDRTREILASMLKET